MEPHVDHLLEMLGKEFAIDPARIFSRERKQEVCEARMIFSYVLRIQWRFSFPRIARVLKQDHSSVQRQVKAMEDRIFKRELVADRLRTIELELKTKKQIDK